MNGGGRPDPAYITSLQNTLADELLRAFGLPKTAWLQRTFLFLFHGLIEQFASGGLAFDQIVADQGLQPAAAWLLERFCKNFSASGLETVPSEGPLLVVSNHPGSIDSLLIMASLRRPDLKLISNDIPFLQHLPATSAHLIYGARADDIFKRMSAVRIAIRHLHTGGALAIMGTGRIDPDPEVYPDAAASLDQWSPSIELFLRQVPQTQVLVAILSGVLSPRWARHPITWLRKEPRRKRLLAEIGQVAEQTLFPRRLFLSPSITFAPPIRLPGLQQPTFPSTALPAVISRAKILLAQHLERVRNS
jgi:hypothetical protein